MTKKEIEESGLGLEPDERIENGTLFLRAFSTNNTENLISVLQFNDDTSAWIVMLYKTLFSAHKSDGVNFPVQAKKVKSIQELSDLINSYTYGEIK